MEAQPVEPLAYAAADPAGPVPRGRPTTAGVVLLVVAAGPGWVTLNMARTALRYASGFGTR